METNSDKKRTLLLVLHVPFYVKEGKIMFESQACCGLEAWGENFDHITIAGPQMPEKMAKNHPSIVWKDLNEINNRTSVVPVLLPWAYDPMTFIANYWKVRNVLAELVSKSHYLQFCPGSFFGDWPAIAALEAIFQNRKYSIHLDRVDSFLIENELLHFPILKKMRTKMMLFFTKKFHNYLIKKSELLLLHGRGVYDYYKHFCEKSFIIHNIHIKNKYIITKEELDQKKTKFLKEKIKICYAGRMEPMKAPLDWVMAIDYAVKEGVELEAIWLGDGSQMDELRKLIEQLGMQKIITLPGNIEEHDKVLETMKNAALMVFTHITIESPRCLIESLACATPIVGYGTLYSRDLVSLSGGGVFVEKSDWKSLGKLIMEIDENRLYLVELIESAYKSGSRFNEGTVFAERSELMKKYLG